MNNVKKLTTLAVSCSILLLSCNKELTLNDAEKIGLTSATATAHTLLSPDSYLTDIRYATLTKFVVRQSTDYVTDGDRLRTALSYNDFNPTGLIPIESTPLQVQVTFHGGTSVKPVLIVGTPEYDNEVNYTLNAGINTINPTLIKNMYIQYVSSTPNKNDSVTVEFLSGFAHTPLFKLGTTTTADWSTQLSTYSNAQYVTLVGKKNYILLTRNQYNTYSNIDPNIVLSTVDHIISLENDISGLDNSSPLHAEPDGKVCIIERTGGYMDATHKGLVRLNGTAAWDKVFKAKNLSGGSPSIDQWGLWHEIGHLHQLWPITPYTVLGEAAPNVYSSYVKLQYEANHRYVTGANWAGAKTYLALSDASKNLASADNFAKLMMYEQLMIAFGEDFMRDLHKIIREEIGITYPLPNRSVTNVDERLGAFAFYASKVTGRNLTTFFQKWGFNLSAGRIALIDALGLPEPISDVSLVNSDDPIINGAYYTINSRLDLNKVLTVKGAATANGTHVELYDNSTIDNSKIWLIRKTNTTEYNFKSRLDTTKVMAVAAAASANGTQVRIWTYDNGPAQRWTPNNRGINIFSYTPACATASRLDVNGNSILNGTKIQIWTANNNNSQDFSPKIQF